MRKLYVLLSTLLVCAFVGCSDDPNEYWITQTISNLRGVTGDIEQVTKTLNDSVADAKKNPPDYKAAYIKIARATTEAGQLKGKAEILQRIKAQTEGRKEAITKEQREEYRNKHKGDFQSALANLDAAQKKLDKALQEADREVGEKDNECKGGLEKLRQKLKESQDEFEVLTRRQT
jgi:hypothetical protein